MGRTENSTERLQASRGHRHWAKEIRPSQSLFGVSGEVRSKNNLTESALLEMSGNATNQASERRLVNTSAFTRTDRGLLRSVLGPWSPIPKCEAPRAPILVEEHTSTAPRPATKVRILRFKNLSPFRHYRGLQNHV